MVNIVEFKIEEMVNPHRFSFANKKVDVQYCSLELFDKYRKYHTRREPSNFCQGRNVQTSVM